MSGHAPTAFWHSETLKVVTVGPTLSFCLSEWLHSWLCGDKISQRSFGTSPSLHSGKRCVNSPPAPLNCTPESVSCQHRCKQHNRPAACPQSSSELVLWEGWREEEKGAEKRGVGPGKRWGRRVKNKKLFYNTQMQSVCSTPTLTYTWSKQVLSNRITGIVLRHPDDMPGKTLDLF